MKIKLFIIVIIATYFFTSCESRKVDGLILTDEQTGKKYMLENTFGMTFYVWEQTYVVRGSDTLIVFKKLN